MSKSNSTRPSKNVHKVRYELSPYELHVLGLDEFQMIFDEPDAFIPNPDRIVAQLRARDSFVQILHDSHRHLTLFVAGNGECGNFYALKGVSVSESVAVCKKLRDAAREHPDMTPEGVARIVATALHIDDVMTVSRKH